MSNLEQKAREIITIEKNAGMFHVHIGRNRTSCYHDEARAIDEREFWVSFLVEHMSDVREADAQVADSYAEHNRQALEHHKDWFEAQKYHEQKFIAAKDIAAAIRSQGVK